MEYLAYFLAVYYITQVMLLSETGFGPFPARNAVFQFVVDDGGVIRYETRPIHLWDRFRWLFRAYDIEKFTWQLNIRRGSVWVCPKCLSFWIAISLFPLLIFNPIVLYPLAAAGLVTYFES